MKITDLIITLHKREPLRGTYLVPSQAGGGSLQMQPFAVMTIETDESVQGHAFLGSSAGASEALVSQVVKLIKPGLIGRNPLDIGAIWQSLWKRNRMLDTQAIGAIDVALWDITGKVANLPIHRLLGTCRGSVPVAGTMSTSIRLSKMSRTSRYATTLSALFSNFPATDISA